MERKWVYIFVELFFKCVVQIFTFYVANRVNKWDYSLVCSVYSLE